MEILTHQNDDSLLRIAFDLLDFNKDGYISEIDLFSVMGSASGSSFTNIVYPDFKTLNEALIIKKKMIGEDDPYSHRTVNKHKGSSSVLYSSIQSDHKSGGSNQIFDILDGRNFSTLMKVHDHLEAKRHGNVFSLTQDKIPDSQINNSDTWKIGGNKLSNLDESSSRNNHVFQIFKYFRCREVDQGSILKELMIKT